MAASAHAGTVTFDTLSSGFVGGGSTCNTPALGTTCINTIGGSPSTGQLGFVADPSMTAVGNVNYGNFTVVCTSCSNIAGGVGAFFPAFSFDLIIHDITDNTTGMFVGSVGASQVYTDASNLTITWVPLQLGPGTSGASGGSGSFGTTDFNITTQTRIVNVFSGAQVGSTTVQGTIANGTPEPTTLGLVGGALIGLGLLRKKVRSGRTV